jgi:hypothetical protein
MHGGYSMQIALFLLIHASIQGVSPCYSLNLIYHSCTLPSAALAIESLAQYSPVVSPMSPKASLSGILAASSAKHRRLVDNEKAYRRGGGRVTG